MKTVAFSESIAAYDLKVGRCRQLIEIMKVCEYIEGQCHFFTIYFPGFVCFVLYLAKIAGERLQDNWSSGFSSTSFTPLQRQLTLSMFSVTAKWTAIIVKIL